MSHLNKYEFRIPLTPYICSTPLDFIEERTYLSENVFCKLKDACKSRGSYFSPIDLRWATGEKKLEQGFFLKTQLDAIKKCSPFFICLLGETYGAYRNEKKDSLSQSKTAEGKKVADDCDWLDKNILLAGSGGHSWVLQEEFTGCSLTELEVTQGALQNDSQYVTLYYRQFDHLEDKLKKVEESEREKIINLYSAESEESRRKIRDLRQRLVNKGIPVKYFRTAEQLGQIVLEDWLEIIDMMFPPLRHDLTLLRSKQYKEWLSQESFIHSRLEVFVSTPDVDQVLQQLTEFVLTSGRSEASGYLDDALILKNSTSIHNILPAPVKSKSSTSNQVIPCITVITGNRGVGKSALAARWLHQFRDDICGICVISNFTSASSSSPNIVQFLVHCVQTLRKRYLLSGGYDPKSIRAETESDGAGQSFMSLCESFGAALALGPCVVLLDGVNELGPASGMSAQTIKECSWLPEKVPSTCRLILTTTFSDTSYHSLAKRPDVSIIKCPDSLINFNTTLQMIVQGNPPVNVLLGEDGVKQLTSLKIIQTALGAKVIGQELSSYRVYSNLTLFLENHAEMCSLRNFWTMCVQSWVKDLSWNLNKPSGEPNYRDKTFESYGWVIDTLCLVAVSRNGLKKDQILSVLKMIGYKDDLEVTEYDWLQLRLCASATLCDSGDGCIVFDHKYLQEITEYTFFQTISKLSSDPRTVIQSSQNVVRQVYHSYLARYFSHQSHSTQTMEELPWQLMMSGNISDLLEYLTDSSIIMKMLTVEGDLWREDFKLYWSVCEAFGQHPANLYLQLANTLGVVDINDVQELDNSDKCLATLTPRIMVSTPHNLEPASDGLGELDMSDSHLGLTTPLLTDPVSLKPKCEHAPDGLESKGNFDTVFVTQGGAGIPCPDIDAPVKNGSDEKIMPDVETLCWYISVFLQDLGHADASKVLFTSLSKYLKQRYPLTLKQQILLCRCHFEVGRLKEKSKDKAGAELDYRLSLHALVAADNIDDEMSHQADLLYLKGLLLCCHGNIRIQDNNLSEAEELLQEAKDCLEDEPDCSVLKSTIFYNLAFLRSSQCDFGQAEAYLRTTLKLRSQWFGGCHSYVANACLALGKLLASPGNVKGRNLVEAESRFRQTLQIQETCLGPRHLSVASVLFDLGQLLSGDKSWSVRMEAQRFLQRSLDIRVTELGADDPLTHKTQQTLTKLDVALNSGHPNVMLVKAGERKSRSTTFINQGAKEGLRQPSRPNQDSRLPGPMSGTAVNREQVMKHNWPDSLVSSSYSLASASDKLLAAPVTATPRLLRREKEAMFAKESSVRTGGFNVPSTASGENGSPPGWGEGSGYRGRGLAGSVENGEVNSKRQTIIVDLQQKEEPNSDAEEGSDKAGDIAGKDYFMDITNKYSEKKIVRIRSSSAPRTLFQRYGDVDIANKHATLGKVTSARSGSNRPIWSARSRQTTSSYASSSHLSHCVVPGCHDITPSNVRSVVGPHSDLKSLLGEPPRPRPTSQRVHHRSAWYHVPGRYVTPQERIPKKRMQKTENAKDIEAFMALKAKWARERQRELTELAPKQGQGPETNKPTAGDKHIRSCVEQELENSDKRESELHNSTSQLVHQHPSPQLVKGQVEHENQMVKFKDPIIAC
ncbi:unnamed protein product [Lymnaea stagnalis]|uniref:Uncharacterized protein n=1 Tax=Lymnaea stagnalis TaxID=6523 RepID=A0AAV2GY02_LYMST